MLFYIGFRFIEIRMQKLNLGVMKLIRASCSNRNSPLLYTSALTNVSSSSVSGPRDTGVYTIESRALIAVQVYKSIFFGDAFAKKRSETETEYIYVVNAVGLLSCMGVF